MELIISEWRAENKAKTPNTQQNLELIKIKPANTLIQMAYFAKE